jgi:hypothetical protein
VVVQVQAGSSGAGKGPDPQSVDAVLRGADEDMENIRLFGDRNTSVVSKVKNGPADLNDADSFQTTYLEPFRVFNTVIAGLADVMVCSLTLEAS